MPQTTGTQQLKLKQAWEYFERHPKCTSLTECGIAHDSRVARTDACNELRQALEERRELMAPRSLVVHANQLGTLQVSTKVNILLPTLASGL